MQKGLTGWLGIGAGGLAVLIVLVLFWAGPFSKPPTLESRLSEHAETLRRAAIEVLEGKPAEKQTADKPPVPYRDLDRILRIAVALLGGLALVLAAASFTMHESPRAAISAALLGAGAIAFQYFAFSL